MKAYERKVQYYETDMMGIAHHANYLHWMEEARIDFMEQIGYSYAEMEGQGVYSPVRSLNMEYLHPCTFNDTVLISVSIAAFNGARLILRYEMKKKRNGEPICTANSEHAFIDQEGHLLRLKRAVPELSHKIELLCDKNTSSENMEGDIVPALPVRAFYGHEHVTPEIIALYDDLCCAWSAETCAPRMREQWSADNPTLGQCSITSFLVQDLFGGKVYGIPLEEGGYHCYNVIGDMVFDLASEQFGDRVLDYEDNPEQFREIHFADPEKFERYKLLKHRLKEVRE